jgi:hypothetical protein
MEVYQRDRRFADLFRATMSGFLLRPDPPASPGT